MRPLVLKSLDALEAPLRLPLRKERADLQLGGRAEGNLIGRS